MSCCNCYVVRRWALCICQDRTTHIGHCGSVCGEGLSEGTLPLAGLLPHFPLLHPLPISKLGSSVADFWGGGEVCVCTRNLWVSAMNSPMRLGVSPTAKIPAGFYNQRFRGFIFLCWALGLCGISCSQVVLPSLSSCKCGTAWSTSNCLAHLVLHQPCCHKSSPP